MAVDPLWANFEHVDSTRQREAAEAASRKAELDYITNRGKPELVDSIAALGRGRLVGRAYLHGIHPAVGPNRRYPYQEPRAEFERKVGESVNRIRDGLMPGPLVAIDFLPRREGLLFLGLGDHDYFALRILGIDDHIVNFHFADTRSHEKAQAILVPGLQD